MIQLHITHTSKGFNFKDDYVIDSFEDRDFDSIKEAKDWLKKTYGNCKRSKMYVDLKDGSSRHIGYIYHYKDADWSHSPVQHWLAQDWVNFSKITRSRITL